MSVSRTTRPQLETLVAKLGRELVRQEIGGESHTNLNAGSNPATSTK